VVLVAKLEEAVDWEMVAVAVTDSAAVY